MDVIIQQAVLAHAKPIAKLYRDFVEYEQGIIRDNRDKLRANDDRYTRLLRILDEFESPRRSWIVALERKKVVGTALLTREQLPFFAGPVGRIDLVVVAPNHRNRGIGEKLLQGAHALAKEKEFAMTYLEVLVDNDHAVRLYEKAGYKDFTRTLVRFY